MAQADQANQAPWDEFNRMRHTQNFFGIVQEDGTWVDSASAFNVAVHWCCMADGHHFDSFEEEVAWVNQSKWSIVHSSLLRKMYEAGLIK